MKLHSPSDFKLYESGTLYGANMSDIEAITSFLIGSAGLFGIASASIIKDKIAELLKGDKSKVKELISKAEDLTSNIKTVEVNESAEIMGQVLSNLDAVSSFLIGSFGLLGISVGAGLIQHKIEAAKKDKSKLEKLSTSAEKLKLELK